MPFQVSPGVNVSEIDLTTVTPAVSSTEGAIAGVFRWGPADTKILVDSESTLVRRFGKPTNYNAETFFTAANFLAYGNKLYVVRAANTTSANSETGSWNAIANVGTVTNRTSFNIRSQDDFDNLSPNFATNDTDVLYIAKWPGALGNSLKVSVCDTTAAFSSVANLIASNTISTNATLTNVSIAVGSNTALIKMANAAGSNTADANVAATSLASSFTIGDVVELGDSTIGRQYAKITTIGSPSTNATHAFFELGLDSTYNLSANLAAQSFTRYWEYYNSVDRAPGTTTYQATFGNTAAKDEVHIAVVDQDGEFSGVPGTVLEVFSGLSRASDAKTADGATNYYKTVINDGSEYIWFANDRANAASNTAVNVLTSTNAKPLTISFTSGTDGPDESTIAFGEITRAYDQFASAESVDISLLLTGKSRGGTNGEQLANYLIDNIADSRRDCVVFVSPERADVVRANGTEATNIVTFRNSLRSSSYAVLDSGYKYQYDKYSDVYRYVPLNGDTAGLCVRTDDTRDPWFSPAGFSRGQIKNIVKLAYNPGKADRDVLYKAGVNPVVTFPGQGTVLFGDKTLLSQASAFDRINVRRLFIVLEKAIAKAAKSLLFEFNDDFTRAQFRNIVEPFLRDVQGRRGITAFKVVCDDSNNSSQVIDSNQFVGDIYIKPAKSINFIQLNFVAVRTGVEFSEIVGSF
jgi:hypothetical protein